MSRTKTGFYSEKLVFIMKKLVYIMKKLVFILNRGLMSKTGFFFIFIISSKTEINRAVKIKIKEATLES